MDNEIKHDVIKWRPDSRFHMFGEKFSGSQIKKTEKWNTVDIDSDIRTSLHSQ